MNYVHAGAELSECGAYRFSLVRRWDPDQDLVCWVMLNPSTADASLDDPTVRRVVGFSKSWGHGGCVIVNLFPLRATDPRELRSHPDPVGPGNKNGFLSWPEPEDLYRPPGELLLEGLVPDDQGKLTYGAY